MSLDPADITAIILAGGRGTRLSSVVSDRPKVLADVAGRPFLAFLLDQLQTAGFRQVVLSTGYMAHSIRDAFGENHGSLRLVYCPEPAPLGTGGAIRLASSVAGGDPILALNGDSYCQVDFAEFLNWSAGREGAIVLTNVQDTSRFGRVRVEDSGRILAFEEKAAGRGPGWINAGIYLLGRSLLKTIPTQGAVSIEREVFPAWIPRGLYGFRAPGRFIDIGSPESYRQAAEFFVG